MFKINHEGAYDRQTGNYSIDGITLTASQVELIVKMNKEAHVAPEHYNDRELPVLEKWAPEGEVIKHKIHGLHQDGRTPEQIADIIKSEHYSHLQDGERYVLPIVREITQQYDRQMQKNAEAQDFLQGKLESKQKVQRNGENIEGNT